MMKLSPTRENQSKTSMRVAAGEMSWQSELPRQKTLGLMVYKEAQSLLDPFHPV